MKRTPLRRTAMKRSRKPASAVPYLTRVDVYNRDNFTCQRCGLKSLTAVYEVQHRKPRKAGGRKGAAAVESYDMANLVLLCAADHADVERDRAQAYDDGWLVREHETPALVPVLTYRGWMYAGEAWKIWAAGP